MADKQTLALMSLYLDRYAYQPLGIKEVPHPNTGLIVVIPVYKEPDILPTLNSLKRCELPDTHIEVLIVINEPENCEPSIHQANSATQKAVHNWIASNQKDGITYLLARISLPKKKAGVGLARKAGMDEAVRRFEAIQNEEGIIVCFDGDSTCASNYLKTIYHAFRSQGLYGASIRFEHTLSTLNDHAKEGIQQYELHLRYYVNALRKAGYPYAFHTIGSSMAVRTDIYKKAGGMNKRKAGEDFHFLHKVIPYGNYAEITTTTVYPSSRVSDRVPFGTGKAMDEWLHNGSEVILSYEPEIFSQLTRLLTQVPAYFNSENTNLLIAKLPSVVQKYLAHENYSEVIREINKQSSNPETFVHRWFLWFNGLRALHFVHYLRDNEYASVGRGK